MQIISEKDRAFVKGIRQAVKEKGNDFNYFNNQKRSAYGTVNCEYFDINGCPSCLIGWGLAAAGYSKVDLDNCYGDYGNFTVSSIVLHLLGFHPTIIQAANIAQDRQDNKDNWGDALDSFEEFLAENDILID